MELMNSNVKHTTVWKIEQQQKLNRNVRMPGDSEEGAEWQSDNRREKRKKTLTRWETRNSKISQIKKEKKQLEGECMMTER